MTHRDLGQLGVREAALDDRELLGRGEAPSVRARRGAECPGGGGGGTGEHRVGGWQKRVR